MDYGIALGPTGTADEIASRVVAIGEAGYGQVAIQLVPGEESAIEDWARLLLRR